MKSKIDELDFIGGQGQLTKDEEVALAQYFAKKKRKQRASAKRIPILLGASASLNQFPKIASPIQERSEVV